MDEVNSKITYFINNVNSLTKTPEEFLTPENDDNIVKTFLKDVYDFVKSSENNNDKVSNTNALPELIIDHFDEEQIWQQIELQNKDKIDRFLLDTKKFISKNEDIIFPLRSKIQESEVCSNDINKKEKKSRKELKIDEENYSEDENETDESCSDTEVKEDETRKIRKSEVDDDFFKLSEMEEFLLAEEKEKNDDDFGIDLFENIPSDDEDNKSEEDCDKERKPYRYKDFFGKSNSEIRKKLKTDYRNREDSTDGQSDLDEDFEKERDDDDEDNENSLSEGSDNDVASDVESDGKRDGISKKEVRFNVPNDDGTDEEEDDEDMSDDGVKSTLDERKQRLTKHIKKLEEEALSEKPWQMKGEIGANSRPQNSLLEEILDFDVTARPAPVMTEAVSERLEDIILRRIKDRAWDDVERKVKPIETVNEYKKRLIMDQSKSKLSLAQIYEQEYVKQRDAATSVGLKAETKEPEELPEHKEIKSMMVSLFAKLNALTNFHYTPGPAAPDVKIVSNLPAIMIEEVAPVSVSDAALLAPEEVLGKKPKELLSKEERTETDKKRERRKKKKWQKIKGKQAQQKSPNAKELNKLANSRNIRVDKNTNSGKVINTSSAFFNKLQDQVNTEIKYGKTKKNMKEDNQINVKRFKL